MREKNVKRLIFHILFRMLVRVLLETLINKGHSTGTKIMGVCEHYNLQSKYTR